MAGRAAERATRSWPACCASHGAQHIGLLAPLVTARKGYLHGSGQVGRHARAIRTCAWTANSCPWPRGRAWTATRNTPSSCRWRDVVVDPANEADLRAAVEQRAGKRPGRDDRWVWPVNKLHDSAEQRTAAAAFSVEARVPHLRHQLPRTGSAPVLVQLQARLVHDLLRHGPAIAGRSTTEQTGEETAWNAWYEGEGQAPCTQMRRHAAESAWRAPCAGATKSISELAVAAGVGRAAPSLTGLVAARPRRRDRPRYLTEIRGRPAASRRKWR